MCLPTWRQLSRDQVKGNSFELFDKSICWLFSCEILPSDKYKGFLCWGSVKQYVSEIWKCQIQRPQYSNSKLIRVLLLGRFQCLRWRTETFAFPKGEYVNRIDRVVSELLFCFQKALNSANLHTWNALKLATPDYNTRFHDITNAFHSN